MMMKMLITWTELYIKNTDEKKVLDVVIDTNK
jgi:hypothetical protein